MFDNLWLLAIMIICGIGATVLILMVFSYYIQEIKEEKRTNILVKEYKKYQDNISLD